MKLKFITTLLIGFSISWTSSAQEHVLYKQIDTTGLYMEVYYPDEVYSTKTLPAMVFFFGGGWKNGNRQHFVHHAQYFSKRGLVCFLVDYRTETKNHTSPFESLKDAKSAIRYVRGNAPKFGIDPDKIIASGGSAGGHLAAATALIGMYNESTDDLSISSVPNALVLFNPVIDNGPGGYGYARIGNRYKDFSPLHNIRKGAPPTLILLGTKDRLIPVETVQYYQKVMEKVGSRCDLRLYQGENHGFFNYNRGLDLYGKTVLEADEFLVSLDYLKDGPKVKIE